MKPAKSKFSVLKQICELIPGHLVSNLSKKHGIDKQSRSFKPWSHIVTMIFSQLSHALSLNDVCDTLKNHTGTLLTMRRASPPSRNGLSHANKVRNADMAEELFWKVLEHLQSITPQFVSNQKYTGFPKRFKRIINVIDSTTIQLVSNCMDWAKHRRRKAAAKCHMRLNLKSFLPNFAIVKEASTHDSTEARELCANIQSGEIVIFDKAYIDFSHLSELHNRGVFWVTRSKDNMAYTVTLNKDVHQKNIMSDQLIELDGITAKNRFSGIMRLITARVDVDGKLKEMTFMTNNLDWSPHSICDLYKSRWAIEVFFKQLKQTLQLADFLGYSKQAVRWQVWTALLTYLLLRYLVFISKWRGSFSRIFTTIKGTLWSNLDLLSILDRYGTADPPDNTSPPIFQSYLPGFIF
jgi:hypothetical protein